MSTAGASGPTTSPTGRSWQPVLLIWLLVELGSDSYMSHHPQGREGREVPTDHQEEEGRGAHMRVQARPVMEAVR